MDLLEEATRRIELLKISRSLANSEYINKRESDHNRWLVDCDIAWKENGIKLPYPLAEPLPSDADIAARAISMYIDAIPKPAPVVANIDPEVLATIDPEIVAAAQPVVSLWDQFINPEIDVTSLAGLLPTTDSTPDEVTPDEVTPEEVTSVTLDTIMPYPSVILRNFRDENLTDRLKTVSLIPDDIYILATPTTQ